MSAIRSRRPKPDLASPSLPKGLRTVIEARAGEVTTDGRVRVTTADGRSLVCRVPLHVSLPWLRAALAHGPVTTEVTIGGNDADPSIWSLFPGPEHAGVIPETVEIAASRRVAVVCGSSKVLVEAEDLRVRSRDVLVSGSRATRVRGGTVKIN